MIMTTLTIKDWNIEEMTGYKPMTSSYRDLSIADKFGISAIKDTIKNLLKNFKATGNGYKYITELVKNRLETFPSKLVKNERSVTVLSLIYTPYIV